MMKKCTQQEFEQQKTKTCSKCKTQKSVWEFSRNSKSKDGLQCWCRLCAAMYYTDYRDANREALASKARDRRASQKFFQTLAVMGVINELCEFADLQLEK